MPKTVPKPEYPRHLEVRRVSNAGTMRFRKRPVFVSQALIQEDVALEEIDDGVWSLRFYDVELARLDERDFKLRP